MNVTFETHPDRYNHWKLSFEGPLATLSLDLAEKLRRHRERPIQGGVEVACAGERLDGFGRGHRASGVGGVSSEGSGHR